MFAGFITWFWQSKIGQYLAIAGAVIVAYFAMKAKHKSEGRAEVIIDQAHDLNRVNEVRREVENDTITNPVDPATRLRDNWTRRDD